MKLLIQTFSDPGLQLSPENSRKSLDFLKHRDAKTEPSITGLSSIRLPAIGHLGTFRLELGLDRWQQPLLDDSHH